MSGVGSTSAGRPPDDGSAPARKKGAHPKVVSAVPGACHDSPPCFVTRPTATATWGILGVTRPGTVAEPRPRSCLRWPLLRLVRWALLRVVRPF